MYTMYVVQSNLDYPNLDYLNPRLSEPSIIRTSNQAKSAGQSTNIRYNTDMRMRSSVQCSYASVNDS